jgi:hypothetical protein
MGRHRAGLCVTDTPENIMQCLNCRQRRCIFFKSDFRKLPMLIFYIPGPCNHNSFILVSYPAIGELGQTELRAMRTTV